MRAAPRPPLLVACAVCAGAVLTGCGAKPDLLSVSLSYDPWAYRDARIEAELPAGEEPAVARGERLPVVGAHVRAVSLGMNELGLPVSGDTLDEREAAASRTGDITARDGSATLFAVDGRDVLIEVKPPVVGTPFVGGDGVWSWWIDRSGSDAGVYPSGSPHTPPAFVFLVVDD